LAGGLHHHRTNIDKYHPGYFGKVGMRYFDRQPGRFWKPVINLDKLWTLVPAESREKYLSKSAGDATPIIDLLALGYSKVLGKGRLPNVPVVVRAVRVRACGEEDQGGWWCCGAYWLDVGLWFLPSRANGISGFFLSGLCL